MQRSFHSFFQLPPGTIIQVWKDSSDNYEFGSWASYLNRAANEGYNVILSSPWYINYISYGKYNTEESVMNLEFFKYYEVEPLKQFYGKRNFLCDERYVRIDR